MRGKRKQLKKRMFGVGGVLLACVSALIIALGARAGVAEAAETSGSCGTNVTWSYDETTKTLTISGTGSTKNYSFATNNGTYSPTPWKDYCEQMEKIVVEDGVTGLGKCAFFGCSKVTSVSLPETLTYIEDVFLEL